MFNRKRRLSAGRGQQLAELFAAGATVREAARQTNTQANTAVRYFRDLRERIAGNTPCLVVSNKTPRHFDAVGFGQIFFGLRLRGEKVQVIVSAGVAKAAGIPHRCRRSVIPDSVVCAEEFRLNFNNKLYTTVPTFRFLKVEHARRIIGDAEQVGKIEEIWGQIHNLLGRFRGIEPAHFYWYLKEVEWRLNGADTSVLHAGLDHCS